MGLAAEKLLSIASAPLGAPVAKEMVQQELAALSDSLSAQSARELAEIWAVRNGLYAFESAFHLFPVQSDTDLSLASWNADELWRSGYGSFAEGWLFFAEDVFGGQFCARKAEFASFEPETGEVEVIATSVEGFFQALLSDYEMLTGQPIAHAWQKRNGRLRNGYRLEAIRPFVLGGKFSIENLREQRTDILLQGRAKLACAIRDLPDGAQLRWPLPTT